MDDPASRSARMSRMGLWLLGFVVACQAVTSGLPHTAVGVAAYGLVLGAALLLWLAAGVERGELALRFGLPEGLFGAFVVVALISSLRATDWFAGVQWTVLVAGYGAAALLAAHLAEGPAARRFLLACLAATGATAAFYGIWHYALYLPALRQWLDREPDLFLAAGAWDAALPELRARVASQRAYGTFVTANQLGAFLVLAFFPLMALALGAWARAKRSPGHVLAALGATLALGVAGTGLVLTRSSGAWLAAAAGAGAFVALALPAPRRLAGRLAVGAAVGLLAAVVLLGVLADPGRLARSLDARLRYWAVTGAIAAEEPALGVGPRGWADHYAIAKPPEAPETQSAHNVWLQVRAETGWTGVLLLAGCIGALAWSAVRRTRGRPTDADGEDEEPREPWRAHLLAGLAVGALALGVDRALLGTLSPPAWSGGASGWQRALPYLLCYAVWAATFAACFVAAGSAPRRLAFAGLAAGLAGLLLHSTGEFLLEVPALGTAAAVGAGLMVSLSGAGKTVRVGLRGAGGLVLFGAGALVLGVWALVVLPPVAQHAVSMRTAESLRLAAVMESRLPQEGGERLAVVSSAAAAAYEQAALTLPWDDAAWHSLAEWLLDAPGGAPTRAALVEALLALDHAVAVRPLHSAHWALMGRAYLTAQRPAAAADAYRQAARLYPSLPAAWYRYALAAEEAGRGPDARAAYERAAGLLAGQYHRRNRVVGPPAELVRLWCELSGRPFHQVVLAAWEPSWALTGAGRRWDELSVGERLAFALRGAGMDAADLLAPGGGGVAALWEAADPTVAGRARTMLDAAADLAGLAGAPRAEGSATDAERVAALLGGLPGAEGLARQWDRLTGAEQERRFWNAGGGRLWQWALGAKARRCRLEGLKDAAAPPRSA